MTRLRTSLRDYLKMRRGLGFKLYEAGTGLLDFVAFMERKRVPRITSKLALEWAQKPKTVLPAEWARRLSWVRGFARYQSAIDPRTEIPPNGMLPYRPQRARPYIYTDQEIKRLLAAARSLPPAGGPRSWKYYCLLGLLSVTGLRLGEALNLKLDDIDLRNNVLTIQKAKFGKSRLVPIHPSTRKVLVKCLQQRERFLEGCASPYLFTSGTGNRLDKGDVHRTFYVLSRQIGLRGPTASRGPRLHDFRHRFAVQTLLNWYRCGLEIEPRLPTLSTYLGHVRVCDTYWYLTAFPELMGQAVERLEKHWEGAR
ncbi:MAG TPA: tyrosine-type recombinase/integrase [Candidatus Sulfotelmatobacter sp.]